MKRTEKLTILLVDDHAPVRQGLRMLLEKDAQIRVVGEAGDGRGAVEMAKKLRPNVILMDISMPLINGLEATRLILADYPSAKVIILSAQVDEEYVNRAKEVGAVGYISKQKAAETLLHAIHEVAKGGILFSQAVPTGLSAKERAGDLVNASGMGGSESLTADDSALLKLVAEGMPKRKIAARHRTRIATIERRLEALMAKLGILSLSKLAEYAVASGYIENDVEVVIV